ncbi:MAG: class I tRNA ligase family protein [Ignavibacteriales bacterium]|nr:class I tRNA ligase family protein [Ignavibacteriales bacterium]
MPKFYITTAIDYVNSRPHLGTAYEKITADVHRALQAAHAACRTPFPDGQRRALAERVPAARRSRASTPQAYCDQMEREFRERLGSAWTCRSTTSSAPPRSATASA